MNKAKAALLIAVPGNEPHLTPLRTPEKNIQEVYKILINPGQGGFDKDKVKCLINPDKDEMWDEIDNLCQQDECELIFLYFSGHGVANEAFNKFYLTTKETCKKGDKFKTTTLLPIYEVAELLNNPDISAQQVIVLDCCLSGEMGRKLADEMQEGLPRAVFTSAMGLESSFESKDMSLSIFSDCFVEGLKGAAATTEGTVTAGSLRIYIEDRLKRVFNNKQTPQIYTPTGREQDIILANIKGWVKPPYRSENNTAKKLDDLLFQLNQAEKAEEFQTIIKLGEDILKIDVQHQNTRVKVAAAYRQRGVNYLNKGQYKEAISDFDNAILFNPENADSYYQRARTYYQQGNWENVIRDCNLALKNETKNEAKAEYYWQRGMTYCNQKDYNQAMNDAHKAIQMDSTKGDYYYLQGLSLYYQGCSLSQPTTGSLLDFQNYLLDSFDPSKRNEINQLYRAAVHSLDYAIRINSKVANYYWIRGFCYSEMGNYDLAIKDFDCANKIDPYQKKYNHKVLVGKSYFQKGDYNQAINYFFEATQYGLNKDAHNADCYYWLSYSYYNRGYSAERNYNSSWFKNNSELQNLLNINKSDVQYALDNIKIAIKLNDSKFEYLMLKGQIENRLAGEK